MPCQRIALVERHPARALRLAVCTVSGVTHERFAHRHLHELLARTCIDPSSVEEVGAQALFCPYYVPLEGRLGADWGVIVNPVSSRFGKLTFEHADCGCPKSSTEDDFGWGRHDGSASQQGDTWDEDWTHACDDFCDSPCEWITC